MTPTLFANYARLGYENCEHLDRLMAQVRHEQYESREDEDEDIGTNVRNISANRRWSVHHQDSFSDASDSPNKPFAMGSARHHLEGARGCPDRARGAAPPV